MHQSHDISCPETLPSYRIRVRLETPELIPPPLPRRDATSAGRSAVFGPVRSSSSGLHTMAEVYESRAIDFQRPNGPYTQDAALEDFGNMTEGWNESRAYITTNQCQIKLLKDALSASGGMIAKYAISHGSEYTTECKLKFHQDFEYCTGGKLGLGFFIGDGAAGGDGSDGQGGSARLVWHKHPSTGEVYLQVYAYHVDQESQYGDTYGRYPLEGSLIKDQWYDTTIYVKSNTGTNMDGRLTLTIDGQTIVDRAMRWTTHDAKRLINRMEFATFRGGATDDYKSATDSYIYYSNMSWKRLAI